jgi:hypothetical protein
MRGPDETQFSIKFGVKRQLDAFKVSHADQILRACNKKRRLVSNSDAIQYLLEHYGKRRVSK